MYYNVEILKPPLVECVRLLSRFCSEILGQKHWFPHMPEVELRAKHCKLKILLLEVEPTLLWMGLVLRYRVQKGTKTVQLVCFAVFVILTFTRFLDKLM